MEKQSHRTERFGNWHRRFVLLLLIFAVPGLSVLAKNSWYLPHADTGHYLTGAIKMKAAHAPVISEGLPVQTVIKAAPPLHIRTSQPAEPAPATPFLRTTVSIQRRPPPASQNI